MQNMKTKIKNYFKNIFLYSKYSKSIGKNNHKRLNPD
jgi:hypothetical protein